jgi:hypothetical protein
MLYKILELNMILYYIKYYNSNDMRAVSIICDILGKTYYLYITWDWLMLKYLTIQSVEKINISAVLRPITVFTATYFRIRVWILEYYKLKIFFYCEAWYMFTNAIYKDIPLHMSNLKAVNDLSLVKLWQPSPARSVQNSTPDPGTISSLIRSTTFVRIELSGSHSAEGEDSTCPLSLRLFVVSCNRICTNSVCKCVERGMEALWLHIWCHSSDSTEWERTGRSRVAC